MIMNIKQRKIQIEPKTKLNYNIYIDTRAVAAMDICFVLVRTHQHGIAVGQR